MKSYFCQKCGREYNLSECLKNGYSLFCFDCPTTRVRITGFPYILIGVFLGLMYFILRYLVTVDTAGTGYVFLPASVGLVIIGFLRIVQQKRLWRKTLRARQTVEDAKKQKDEEKSRDDQAED